MGTNKFTSEDLKQYQSLPLGVIAQVAYFADLVHISKKNRIDSND